MMWCDYYLKLPDEAAYQSIRDELVADSAELDAIGQLFRFEDGVMMVSEGYHVNARLKEGVSLPASAEAYMLEPPALPKRVFMAG